jgi:monoamine oxidase
MHLRKYTIVTLIYHLLPHYTSRAMTSCAAAVTTLDNVPVDVIIVGAGISGLVCSNSLIKQGASKTVVLEARNRVGGRLLSFDGGIDLGASWGWPPHESEGVNLAKDLGIKVLKQKLEGNSFQLQNGEMYNVGENGGRMAPCGPDAVRFHGGYSALAEKLAQQLLLIEDYDSCDVTEDGTKTEETSLTSTSDSNNHKLLLGAVVKKIEKTSSEKDGDFINVTYEKNKKTTTIRSKRVVVALPPAVVAKSIEFQPQLNTKKLKKMMETMTWCGDWCKIVATFKTNFWRKNGASGVVSTNGLPISIWWEGGSGDSIDSDSYESSSSSEPAAIVGLGFGVNDCKIVHNMIHDDEQLRTFIINTLGQAFPGGKERVAEQLLLAGGKSWAMDPLTFGGRSGKNREYGHPLLKEEIEWGGVHFAGSETEPLHGHVEGAIVAGKRAAREVIASLR